MAGESRCCGAAAWPAALAWGRTGAGRCRRAVTPHPPSARPLAVTHPQWARQQEPSGRPPAPGMLSPRKLPVKGATACGLSVPADLRQRPSVAPLPPDGKEEIHKMVKTGTCTCTATEYLLVVPLNRRALRGERISPLRRLRLRACGTLVACIHKSSIGDAGDRRECHLQIGSLEARASPGYARCQLRTSRLGFFR